MPLYGPDDRPLPPADSEQRDPIFDPRAQDRGFSPSDARRPTTEYMDAARLAVERALERLDAKELQGVSLETFAKELAFHGDGFSNGLTGLGDPAFDKTLGGRAGGPGFRLVRRTYQECSDVARGSDLGQNIVNKPADEMTREGWDVDVQPTEEDIAVEGDPVVKLDAARRSPRRAAAGWRKDAKRCAAKGDRIGEARGRSYARRWDAVAMGMDPPEAAPPPPRGPLPKINDDGIELSEAIDKWAEAIDVVGAVNQSLRYERGFGGGAVFIGVDDGVADLTQPLDPTRVKAVTHLTPLAGGLFGEVVMWRPYNDGRKPKFGLPEIYQVRNQYVQMGRPPAPGETRPVQQNVPIPIWYVHESRMLVFDGEPMSRQARQEMSGWGDSVFTRVAEPLAQYEQTWNAVAVLMQEFSIATLSIEGLSAALAKQGAANARQNFLQYALFQNLTQSVARMRFIDSREKMERVTATVAGVAEILREYSLRLAAAADMPVSLLFGQVQGGLGNTGNTDLRWFYDRIRSKQVRRLLPQLQYLYRLGWLAKNSPTRGVEPDRWAITFRPLWQMTDLERADLRAKTATADAQEITSQVVTPEEVAATRYGGAEYNTGPIMLDRESRGGAAEYDQGLAAKVAQEAAADPYAAPGVTVAAATPGYGSASVPIPPMTAMPSSPITGDPQSTPGNIGTEDTRSDEFSESDHPRDPHGLFAASAGGAVSGKWQRTATKPVPQKEGGKPGAAPGSQLDPHVLARLKEIGARLPPAHIGEVHVSEHLHHPEKAHEGAVVKWTTQTKSGKPIGVVGVSLKQQQASHERIFGRTEEMRPKMRTLQKELETHAATSQPHAAAALIAATGLRRGSDDNEPGHYGALTMEARHVTFNGGKAHIEYVGKEGVVNRATVEKPAIVHALRSAVEGKKPSEPVWSKSVNERTVQATLLEGQKIKDLRTIKASAVAERTLARVNPQLTGDEKKDARMVGSIVRGVSGTVANRLNNKPAQSLESYIAPSVFRAWGEKHGINPAWLK